MKEPNDKSNLPRSEGKYCSECLTYITFKEFQELKQELLHQGQEIAALRKKVNHTSNTFKGCVCQKCQNYLTCQQKPG